MGQSGSNQQSHEIKWSSGWFPHRDINQDSQSPRRSRPLNLCLHKRDFLPGHWIVDNIMSAMERSRQTIFVLSENFVRSDWCRYELDFSHFWIFEGNAGGEPAILILLEPLSKDDIPKRFCKLRKLMSSTTYLEWPQEEDKVEEFWQRLHNALQSGEDHWREGRQCRPGLREANEFLKSHCFADIVLFYFF